MTAHLSNGIIHSVIDFYIILSIGAGTKDTEVTLMKLETGNKEK